jgi:hypothetical protein
MHFTSDGIVFIIRHQRGQVTTPLTPAIPLFPFREDPYPGLPYPQIGLYSL